MKGDTSKPPHTHSYNHQTLLNTRASKKTHRAHNQIEKDNKEDAVTQKLDTMSKKRRRRKNINKLTAINAATIVSYLLVATSRQTDGRTDKLN